ncbi:hypothetical protein CC80DRAFT_448618 [Byssothecium circinans]|uniref:NACHT domain-containing protein n=1 Tax=Byssothecium circinans TaxID=147558 RepID=A0A6A5TPQ8_9PLEO|nr:hypothetical protein CC80DRAFT_448618 [Byssothecium circinans]
MALSEAGATGICRKLSISNTRSIIAAQGTVQDSTFNIYTTSDERRNFLRDLILTDPCEDKDDLKRRKGNRVRGTCEWILHAEELTTWLHAGQVAGTGNTATNILWLYGNPGTGKSTMSIFLAEELPKIFLSEGRTFTYFFCDSSFDKRKTATSVIRGLLLQLLQQHSSLLEYLIPKYTERGKQLFESFDALWTILLRVAADKTTGRKYCIIDALDECDQESQKMLLTQLEETFNPRNSSDRISSIRFLITSRPYPEIRECLEQFAHRDLASFQEAKQDIELFIDERVARLQKKKRYTEKVKNSVTKALKDKAEGTFLWVGLACVELNTVQSNKAVKLLQELPKGLHSLYRKLLGTALELETGGKDTIKRILSFVAVSLRPLSLLELSVACQLHQDEDEEERIQFMREEVASCRLIVIVQDEKVLLLHQSAKDFLVGPGADHFVNVFKAHATFAYRCVDHLIRHFYSKYERDDTSSNGNFLSYSTQTWADHAHMAESEFKVEASQAEFFDIQSKCREYWLQCLYRSEIPKQFSIFHVAARWGIPTLVDYVHYKEILNNELDGMLVTRQSMRPFVDVEYLDSAGVTPLEEAAISGHANVISRLLDHGTKEMWISGRVMTVAAGNEANGQEVMALLLDRKGDEITITEEVVKAAAGNWRNGEEVMALLLDRKGDQVTITEEVVKAAAENWGNGKEVMALLLDRKGDQITEEVVRTIAGRFDGYVMALLLDRKGDQITITEEVVGAAAGNWGNGRKVMTLLLKRRGD